MANCPHCDEALPDVRGEVCPYCRGKLKERSVAHRRSRSEAVFWMAAWLGTISGGALFGLGFGVWTGLMVGMEIGSEMKDGNAVIGGAFGALGLGIGGLFLGSIIAAALGALMHFSVAVVMWFSWLTRFRFVGAGFAGSLTGALGMWLSLGAESWPGSLALTTLAGLIGMTGSILVATRNWSNGKPASKFRQASKGSWQFTLGDLFLRITVASVLIGVLLAIINALQAIRK